MVDNFICPRCGKELYWTGDVCQNPNENRWAAIEYVYECRNIDCNYKLYSDKRSPAADRSINAMTFEDYDIEA